MNHNSRHTTEEARPILLLYHSLQLNTQKMTKQNSIYLSDLHFEHKQWNSELMFWKDEIATFEHRLEEIVSRYTSKDVLSKLEHFQNQLILHGNAITYLLKDIKTHEKELSQFAMEHPVAIDHVRFDDHTGLRIKMETQRELYTEMKKLFFDFVSKSM
ncbi:MAG TPA: hypothetical protein VK169_05890 [Saprospiraceae bacterium]|nr:hypothetical protein [Saprospiraceae bacterium]